jgi:hypothetical protein
MKWVLLSERKPTYADGVNGRIPILDFDGYLAYGLMAGPAGHEFLLSEFDVKY